MKDWGFDVALVFAGMVFCWFSLGGLADLMPLLWAVPLALLITLLYSIACCKVGASRTVISRIGFGFLALLMWSTVVVSDGLSFNEIITYEGGDRVNVSEKAAQAHFSEAELERRELELDALHSEADRLLAEAVEAEAAASPAVFAALEAELSRELQTGPGPKTRDIEARIADLREKEGGAAGIRARHNSTLERISRMEASLGAARSSAQTSLTKAAVAEGTQHFIFNLASARAGLDRDKTGAFLSLLGTIYFGALELVYGCFCAVAAYRKRIAGERDDPALCNVQPQRHRFGEEAANITRLADVTANRPSNRSVRVPRGARTVPSPGKDVPSGVPDKDVPSGVPGKGVPSVVPGNDVPAIVPIHGARVGNTKLIPPEKRAVCRKLKAEGMKVKAIARRTGVSVRSIYRICSENAVTLERAA